MDGSEVLRFLQMQAEEHLQILSLTELQFLLCHTAVQHFRTHLYKTGADRQSYKNILHYSAQIHLCQDRYFCQLPGMGLDLLFRIYYLPVLLY